MGARFRPAVLAAIVGLLTGCVGAPGSGGSATAVATASPSERASAPAASASLPAPSAIPSSTPQADPALLELNAIGCPGGTVLEWTPSRHPNFHHYTALRSPETEIAPDYPPIAPAVDWGETYATDAFITSAVDASILPSDRDWNYRVMAYDILNGVVSASPVRSARIGRVLDLGELDVTTDGDGVTSLEWEPFEGDAECFSSYQLMFGIGGPPNTVLSTISDPSVGAAETDALHGGTTYQLRIDAVRVTTLGDFVVARSETAIYTVP